MIIRNNSFTRTIEALLNCVIPMSKNSRKIISLISLILAKNCQIEIQLPLDAGNLTILLWKKFYRLPQIKYYSWQKKKYLWISHQEKFSKNISFKVFCTFHHDIYGRNKLWHSVYGSDGTSPGNRSYPDTDLLWEVLQIPTFLGDL